MKLISMATKQATPVLTLSREAWEKRVAHLNCPGSPLAGRFLLKDNQQFDETLAELECEGCGAELLVSCRAFDEHDVVSAAQERLPFPETVEGVSLRKSGYAVEKLDSFTDPSGMLVEYKVISSRGTEFFIKANRQGYLRAFRSIISKMPTFISDYYEFTEGRDGDLLGWWSAKKRVRSEGIDVLEKSA